MVGSRQSGTEKLVELTNDSNLSVSTASLWLFIRDFPDEGSEVGGMSAHAISQSGSPGSQHSV